MSYMNLEYGPVCHECFVAQWLEHQTRSYIGSIPVRESDFFFVSCSWHVDHIINFSKNTVNSIKPLGGIFISNPFEGGLDGDGGLFNLEKTMVSVLNKELEYKVEKLNYKKLEVMQPKNKNKSELPVGK